MGKQVKLPVLLRNHGMRAPALPERMRWSQSSVKLFRKCKRKFFWRYIMQLRRRHRAGALMVGDTFHLAVAEWYRSKGSSMGKLSKRFIDAVAQELLTNADYYDQEQYEKVDSQIEMLGGMLTGYGDCYANDRKEWLIDRKQIELEFMIDMGTFDFSGKIDLLARTAKGRSPFLVEHKTASNIKQGYIDRLPLDTQCRSYIFGAVRGHGITPGHVLYDVVRKCKLRRKSNESHDDFTARIATDYMARPDFYFYREELKFSSSDIAAFEHELRQTHHEYELIARGEFGDPLDPRTWTPNDSTCEEYYTVCEFRQLCLEGLDAGNEIAFTQKDEEIEEEEGDE